MHLNKIKTEMQERIGTMSHAPILALPLFALFPAHTHTHKIILQNAEPKPQSSLYTVANQSWHRLTGLYPTATV